MSIEIKGRKELIVKLERKTKAKEKAAGDAIREATLFMAGEVKASIAGQRDEKASVDTGQFLNSIQSQSSGLEGEVSSPLHYPTYLEYGTSRIAPRPHFGNSLKRNASKVSKFVKEKVSNA
jgi:HK97 gp10 family phage protein